MPTERRIPAALVVCLAALLGWSAAARAEDSPVTAIDIALEPDATMMQHAEAANAILLKAFPKGYTLDASHQPHITMEATDRDSTESSRGTCSRG